MRPRVNGTVIRSWSLSIETLFKDSKIKLNNLDKDRHEVARAPLLLDYMGNNLDENKKKLM